MPQKHDQDARPDEKLLKLYILLLFNDHEYSLTELTRLLTCSKQTVSRLLQRIDQNYPNHLQLRKQGRQNYYRLMRPSASFRTAIDPHGLRQLALCRDLMAHILPKEDLEALNISLQQAKTNLPRQELDSYEDTTLGFALAKGQINYEPLQDILHKLEQCILEGRCCKLMYQKEYGQSSAERYFAPQHLISYHDILYCQGWLINEQGRVTCVKDKPVTFLIHRITDLTIQPGRFSLDLPEAKLENSQSFGIIKGESLRIRVHFSPRVKTYICDRIWSDDQVIEEHEDGSITLTFSSTSKQEVLSFVSGFNAEAELLEPEDLRAELIERIDKMQKLYAKKKAPLPPQS